MDEDFLIDELADSDDEMKTDLFDVLFTDLRAQGSSRLLGAYWLSAGEHCNLFPSEGVTNDSREVPTQSDTRPATAVTNTNIVPLFTPTEFIQQFRVQKALAELLINKLRQEDVHNYGYGHLDYLPPDVQILSFLWFLGQDNSDITDICSQFNIDSVCFDYVLHKVTGFLCKLWSKHICFPGEREKKTTKAFYARDRGFQGVIGCLDTVLINVMQAGGRWRKTESHNRAQSYVVQAVFNEESKFTDVFVCETAASDYEVLLRSPLYKVLPSVCSDGEYLLGGASYPCLRHLLTPFPDEGCVTGGQIYFNLRMAACLQTADNGFSLLTRRFRQLLNLELPKTVDGAQLINACCVLHNMSDNDDFENIDEPPVVMNTVDNRPKAIQRRNSPMFTTGLKFRDDVCEQLLQE